MLFDKLLCLEKYLFYVYWTLISILQSNLGFTISHSWLALEKLIYFLLFTRSNIVKKSIHYGTKRQSRLILSFIWSVAAVNKADPKCTIGSWVLLAVLSWRQTTTISCLIELQSEVFVDNFFYLALLYWFARQKADSN